MKTSTIALALVVLIAAAGAWWWFVVPHTEPVPESPGAAGINGSPNQGNLGQQDSGAPQQPSGVDNGIGDASGPGGDGTGVAQNLILGLNADAKLGSYLSAYNGMTLYTYDPDKQAPGASACTGSCAALWPPYTVSSAQEINVPANITGKVGVIKRADGKLQVIYNGRPLYFYLKDTKSGDISGQGVGGVWFVAKP